MDDSEGVVSVLSRIEHILQSMQKEQREFHESLLKLLAEQQRSAATIESELREANEYLAQIGGDITAIAVRRPHTPDDDELPD